jgi:DNA polymerase
MRVAIDIETRSSVDIMKYGVYAYRESRDFKALIMGYNVGERTGATKLTTDEGEIYDRVRLWLDKGYTLVAHNVNFERTCLAPTSPLLQWDDTQPRAGEHGYPQQLKTLAQALGAEPKDEAGWRLINLFCKPQKDGSFARPEDHPEKWAEFCAYCTQDVDTLVDIDSRLMDWPTEMERRIWEADQLINDRGVKVDLELARAAIEAAEQNQMVYELEIMQITGVENPGSVQQLLGWLEPYTGMTDLRKETVQKELERDLPADVRRVLELRQELALTASKKYLVALHGSNRDGRIRGQFRFFGAHTGRWAGRGMQLQNLPRESLKTDEATEAAILDLKMGLGADATTLKALVRPTLVGPFTVVDYSAIEARVIAWLAGEEWALQAFRDGRDIYVETAERMGGLTRAQGKVAVLALGYNGAIGSLRAMGAEGDDDELLVLVKQWRKANARIVKLWAKLEEAFRNGGQVGDHLRVVAAGKTRYLRLPSGRAITYHGCTFGNRIKFRDPKYGTLVDTYGGRLTENATQAVARDILGEALVRLEERGYPVVGHIHDEVLVEGEYPVDEIVKVMCELPDWAEGLPVDAEGFQSLRYKKG